VKGAGNSSSFGVVYMELSDELDQLRSAALRPTMAWTFWADWVVARRIIRIVRCGTSSYITLTPTFRVENEHMNAVSTFAVNVALKRWCRVTHRCSNLGSHGTYLLQLGVLKTN
jgi:hypothetical protein